MCDFNKFLGKAKIKETGEIIDVVDRGNIGYHAGMNMNGQKINYSDDIGEIGMYHICATGSFFAYSNGEKWESAYNHPKYEFMFEERSCGHGYIMSDAKPIDIDSWKLKGKLLDNIKKSYNPGENKIDQDS